MDNQLIPVARVQAVLGSYRVTLVPPVNEHSNTLLEALLNKVPAENRQAVLCAFWQCRNRLLTEIEFRLTQLNQEAKPHE